MDIYVPLNLESLKNIIFQKCDHPRYIRINNNEEIIDKPYESKFGTDANVCTMGELYYYIKKALQKLPNPNRFGLLAIEHFTEDADNDFVKSPIIVIEDHCKIGGLADYLATKNHKIIAHKYLPIDTGGLATSEKSFREMYGFDESSIISWMLSI
jgi:hypothetical protein